MVRRRYLKLLPLAEARERFLSACAKLGVFALREEEVAVWEALGRPASQEVKARIPSPAMSCAAMDGFAVQASDTAGAKPTAPVILTAGKFLAVDTGAPVPSPFDAIVPLEEASEISAGIEVRRAVAPGQHLRPVGEDFPEGASVVPKGRVFGPAEVAACLATGNPKVWVRPKLKVLFIPTGSELIPAAAPFEKGKVYETNSLIFQAYVERWGGEVEVHPIVPDALGLLARAVEDALSKNYDLICICAGSSKGRGDYTPDVLSRMGELVFHGVAMAPGKPTLFAIVEEKPVLGLPGYPVALWVSLMQFLRPLFEEYYGIPLARGEKISGVLGQRVHSTLGTREFVRVKIEQSADGTLIIPLPGGSSRLSSLVFADGILEVPEEVEFISKGEKVEVERLPPW